MADIFSASKRSEIMFRVKGKETTPEIIAAELLFVSD